jgi:hypothetical protein
LEVVAVGAVVAVGVDPLAGTVPNPVGTCGVTLHTSGVEAGSDEAGSS